jgi:hypothetical protein
MQTKKRKTEPRATVQPKVRTSRPAKTPALDDRRILIVGRSGGKVVAQDRTDSNWKAQQVAAGWRASGFEVEIVETGPTSSENSAGAGSRVVPSASILGHPGASSGGGFAN